MFADRRRLMIGAAVIVVIALGVWWQSGPVATPGAPVPARVRTPRAPVAATAEGSVDPLRLEALAGERAEPSGTPRNPFRYQPKVVAAPARPARPVETEPAARPAGPTVPPGPPPAPPIALKFIALVERASGVKWAVLSDGKVTMYGRDGDTIDGRYRIVKIGAESVEVSHLDGRGRQVIRLTGQ